jgi:hypothetical protein
LGHPGDPDIDDGTAGDNVRRASAVERPIEACYWPDTVVTRACDK